MDRPEVYNLPPDPVDPTVEIGGAWRSALVAGPGDAGHGDRRGGDGWEPSMSETLRALESPAASTEPGEGPTYYGRPAMKEPVWIWSVPAYLFVGGVGAGASTVAGAAQVLDRERLDWLVTRGRWVSVAPGRPGRRS